MEITDKNFWIDYWKDIKLPWTVNFNLKSEKAIAMVLKKHIPMANFDKKAIEIGCAPGKWLIMLNKELFYKIDGYEYIDYAAQKTRENLALNGIPVEHFNIITGDFMKDSIQSRYEVVLSLGFIEHFENFELVIEKHLNLLTKGGYLIIGVPNFRGINFLIHKIIDKYQDQKMLPNHNLAAMSIQIYENIAGNKRLNIEFLDYVGGFEPAIFDPDKITNKFIRTTLKLILRICNRLFCSINTRFTSGYLLAVYKNPANN